MIEKYPRLHSLAIRMLQCNRSIYVLKNYFLDTDALFKQIEIETCSICNRNCEFCPVSLRKRPAEFMKTELFHKIIQELKEINYQGLISLHHYGEPLLDDRLEDFIKEIRAELGNNRIEINTNGDFISTERYNSLKNAGLSLLRITQYDKTPKDNLQEFLSHSPKDVILEVKNEDTLGLYNRGGAIKLKHDFYPIACNPMIIAIRSNGEVNVCCNDFFNKIQFGNINNEKIIDIWNKIEYRNWRKDIKDGVFTHPVCRKCLGL